MCDRENDGTSSVDEPKNILGPDYQHKVPVREIFNMADMSKWEKSEAYCEYLGFIMALNDGVKGKPNSCQYTKSFTVDSLCKILETLSTWIDEIPPIDQPQRFGNKAFRTWHTRLIEESGKLLEENLESEFVLSIIETKVYLIESFGNSTRIDYGTGHEMAFCMFLLCLFKAGALVQNDKTAVVLCVFNKYMDVVRKLQTVYKMEPAGSRGVWALDDFQFVPFIWGSSQLIGHPRIEPGSFIKDQVVQMFAKEFMFLSCIQYITEVKKGPFAEHSNQLWNISAVPSWQKVNQGLIKMYKAEVLSKFPVIQHVLFGSILPISIPKRDIADGETNASNFSSILAKN